MTTTSTSFGLTITAMTKTTAINAPTAMAVGMSRAFAFAGLVGGRAVDPERAGRPPRVGSPGRPCARHRPRPVVGGVGADGDAARLAAQRDGVVAIGDVVGIETERARCGITCSISSVSSCGSTGWSSRHTGAFPANDDQTSRSSDGSGADVGQRARHLAGGRLRPVRQRPGVGCAERQSSVVSSSSSVSSANNGGPKSSSSPSSGRRSRHASSVMAIPFCSLRPRAVPALCGRTPCRSAPRARG